MDEIRTALAPFYAYLKLVHVLAAALWSFSTVVAWVHYLKPALVAARRQPADEALRARRDDAMKRFDRGARYEHVAFALLVVTAILLLWINGFDWTQPSYVTAKLWIGILVIVPMEAVDIYLSHMGGNKERLHAAGDRARFERMMDVHWIFFRITEPIVVILIPAMFVLAVVKPF